MLNYRYKLYLKRIFFLIAGLFFLSGKSFAGCDFIIDHISLQHGLSQSSIYTLTQDNDGYIWAGTQDGLNKFDGLHFRKYYNQPFDSTSLPGSNIMAVFCDSNNRMWIGTSGFGLALKYSDTSFYTYNTKNSPGILNNWITKITEDRSGNIWVANAAGIFMITPDKSVLKNGKLSIKRIYPDKGLADLSIYALTATNEGDIWFSVRGEGVKCLKKGGSGYSIEEYNSDSGLAGNLVRSIRKDKHGHLWVLSSSGLSLYDPSLKKFNCVYRREDEYELNDLLCASDGTLWICTGRGMYYVSAEEASRAGNKSLSLTKCTDKILNQDLNVIAEDKISTGLIWVGTDASGIIKLVPRIKKFNSNSLEEAHASSFVFSFLENGKDQLWIGTSSGLIRFQKSRNKYDVFRKDQLHSPSDYVQCMMRKGPDEIWLGTIRGLVSMTKIASEKPVFRTLVVNKEVPDAAIRKLVTDERGDVYVVLPRKVFRFRKGDNRPELVLDDSTISQLSMETINSSLLFDKNGNAWLSTMKGLFVFPKSSSENVFATQPYGYFHRVDDKKGLRSDGIDDMYQDSKGTVWICTGNGLTAAQFENGKMNFRNYSTEDGLINNMVYGVLEDTLTGKLWFSTNGGLTAYSTSENKFRNYTLRDGLQSNEFDAGAYFQAPDHKFYFGGVNGYTEFYPWEIREDSVRPKVYITGYSLPGKEVTYFSDSTKQLVLDYSDNSFSVNFAALQYTMPAANTFAYMLEGYHQDWIYSGATNQVNFSRLPPGSYALRIKAANADGFYNEAGDKLLIVIHPPFWQTAWFYLLIAAFVTIILYSLYRYKIRMTALQHAEIEKIRKETAADFHDELGHKLTTISWFAQILKKRIDPQHKEEKAYLDKIIDTSANLYHTMKDLLWAMDPGKDSMNDLYLQMRHFGESLYDQTGVEFAACDSKDEWSAIHLPFAHKRHVLLIFKEAMHNSLKHSGGSKIELTAFRKNGSIGFQLKDNGSGFRFNWENAGNGLRNAKKRSEIINGKLKINSNDTGTEIELLVPLKHHL